MQPEDRADRNNNEGKPAKIPVKSPFRQVTGKIDMLLYHIIEINSRRLYAFIWEVVSSIPNQPFFRLFHHDDRNKILSDH